MIKKIAFACLPLFLVACSSEIRQLKETEYLRTQPGKPLVYPENLDRPAQEKTFVIPELSRTSQQPASQPPELLALPPRLAGVDVSEDEEEEERGGDSENAAAEEVKPADDGFIATPMP